MPERQPARDMGQVRAEQEEGEGAGEAPGEGQIVIYQESGGQGRVEGLDSQEKEWQADGRALMIVGDLEEESREQVGPPEHGVTQCVLVDQLGKELGPERGCEEIELTGREGHHATEVGAVDEGTRTGEEAEHEQSVILGDCRLATTEGSIPSVSSEGSRKASRRVCKQWRVEDGVEVESSRKGKKTRKSARSHK